MKQPEPVHLVKERRDTALAKLVGQVPYLGWLGIGFERKGDELTATLKFAEKIVGNPMLPAIHGGVTAAFLEATATIQLAWSMLWDEIESGQVDAAALTPETMPRLPKTIDLTVDYLRSGLPRDAYARARGVRSGRRYASVQVEAWQDNRDRPFAAASGHFLMPRRDD